MENNDDIDKLFKNSFENMEFKPNDKDWLAMKDKMQKEGIISKPSNNKKGIYLWSAIALLFMGSIGMYFIFSNTPNSNELNPTLTQNTQSTQIEVKKIHSKTVAINTLGKQPLIENKSIQNQLKGEGETGIPLSSVKKQTIASNVINNSSAISNKLQLNTQEIISDVIIANADTLAETNRMAPSGFNRLHTTTIRTIQTIAMKEKTAIPSFIKNDRDKRAPIPCPVILGNTKKHLFYAGPYISADKNVYTMVNNGDVADSDQLEGENNFQYTAGAIVGMSINSRVSIETGVLYAQKIKLNTTVIDGANTYSFNYNGKYIDVPIRAKIYLNKQFLRWYVMPGIVANINAPSNGYFKDDVYGDATYTISLMPQSVGMSVQLGTGLEWTITDRISWYVEPSFKYALSPVVKHNTYELPIDHLINTISLGTGINFKF